MALIDGCWRVEAINWREVEEKCIPLLYIVVYYTASSSLDLGFRGRPWVRDIEGVTATVNQARLPRDLKGRVEETNIT